MKLQRLGQYGQIVLFKVKLGRIQRC